MSDAGGTPTPVTALQGGEVSHRWPWFLPDGQHFLFLATREACVAAAHRVADLRGDGSTWRDQKSSPVCGGAPAVRRRHDHGPAVRSALETSSPENRFPSACVSRGRAGRLNVSLSQTNVLLYEENRRFESRLVWVDRTGNRVGTVGESSDYRNFSLSPDDRKVAVSWRPPGGNIDIGVMDLERGGNLRRVTDDVAVEFDPAWLRPHGNHLVFNSVRTGSFSLFRRPSDSSGTDTLVVQGEFGRNSYITPDSSPDGKFLIFVGGVGVGELFVQELTENAKPSVFFQSRVAELNPAFSPDGRFVTYSSNATGRFEIYVRRFPDAGGEQRISRDGGSSPRWRSDKEIVFLSPDAGMMSAPVFLGATFRSDTPRPLFRTGLVLNGQNRPYDVTRDGRRFLLLVPNATMDAGSMTVLINWTARLRK